MPSQVEQPGWASQLADVASRAEISCVPYFSLANGFLTGKYRPGVEVDSQRAGMARRFLDDRGMALRAVLDEVAGRHGTTVAAVSLAWLVRQPTVAAVLASARTPAQVAELTAMTAVALTDADMEDLATLSSAT